MSDFAARLIAWHRVSGRHALPWQNTRDPYRIWLSEIMLQQTQVETVIPYFERFLARFPDVTALAAAPLDEVLGYWSGLGYYARARNLHKAARTIAYEYGGRFPPSAEAIAALPGIGRSTAAAIAAFAYGEKGPILDGNVKRVLCRAFGVEGFPGEKAVETRLWALAESLLPDTGIANYIQAQMDLGATLCTRSRPACTRCPLATDCVALRTDRVAALPSPKPKKAIPQRSIRVAVIQSGAQVLLERRPPSGIWGGLLALPEISGIPESDDAWLARLFGLTALERTPFTPVRHVFTHFRLDMLPMHFRVGEPMAVAERGPYVWLALEHLDAAGLPAPVRRILETLERHDLFSQDDGPANR